MWLATTIGFYSAVEHRDLPDDIIVRARDRADLERLLALDGDEGTIEHTPRADYPYRVVFARECWARLAGRLAGDIDYPNFKDAVKARQGATRASVYMRVWAALRSIEPWSRGRFGNAKHDAQAGQRVLIDLDVDHRLSGLGLASPAIDIDDECPRCDGFRYVDDGDPCPLCNVDGDPFPF